MRAGAGQSIPASDWVENAKKISAVALAEAKKNNWYMAVAVVDPSGTLVYYEKMDNTQTGSATVAIEKARTAAMFKRPTKVFDDAVAGGGAGLRALRVPGVIPVEGRIPLVIADKSAVSVSECISLESQRADTQSSM